MKPRGILLSRWFYYGLVALALFVLIFVALPYWASIGVISRELELDLFSSNDIKHHSPFAVDPFQFL